jgi:2-haloacid dehalogenase
VRIKAQYPFLDLFEGALVSGEVGLVKPDPAFFTLLVETFDLAPAATLYVEDNAANLRAAAESGFVTHLFESAEKLAQELVSRGLLVS